MVASYPPSEHEQKTNRTLFIRLYLDEDVFKGIAPALRARGFDAVSVHELDRYGWSDAEHLICTKT